MHWKNLSGTPPTGNIDPTKATRGQVNANYVMNKRWNILTCEEGKETALFESLKINSTLCRILVQRGIDDFEKARAYFRPQLTDLHDPYLMKDMDRAVDRILASFNKKEPI